MSSVLRFDEWQDSDGNPVASGVGGFSAPGSIIAVKDVLKTDTFSASVAAGGNVAVTGLSITHEVADPANKLIISAVLGAAANNRGVGNVGLAVHDGTSLISIGDSAGSRTRVTTGGWVQGTGVANSNLVVAMPSVTFVHTPGAGSKTYTVRAINIETAAQTLYINRNEADTDQESNSRAVSSIVIMEVAV